MTDLSLANDLGVIIVVALVSGFLFWKLKQPLITGYLLGGMIIGSSMFNLFGGSSAINTLAEIGISFMLFSLGIEFAIDKISAVKKTVIIGSIIQLILTSIVFLLILHFAGLDAKAALVIALVFSQSATAAVLKLLTEKGELDTIHGEIILGWLLLQDLAAIPALMIIDSMSASQFSFADSLILPILKSVLVLVVTLVAGNKIIPIILRQLAKTSSHEILTLTAVSICLGLSLATQSLGLSVSLGAFLAGLLISRTNLNLQLFSEIRPIRDMFSVLFFVSIGAMVDPVFILKHLVPIILLLMLVLIVKIVVVFVLNISLGQHTRTALNVALGIFQVGELSFVMLQKALATKIITSNLYSTILIVSIFSIILTPTIFNSADKIYNCMINFTKKHAVKLYRLLFIHLATEHKIDQPGLNRHVIVCGYGRVGKYVGEALAKAKIPFIVIDIDIEKIQELEKAKVPCIYGDPTDIDILEKADMERARAAILALPNGDVVKSVAQNARSLNSNAIIITRSHHPISGEEKNSIGIDELVEPEFEAALSMVHKVLPIMGKPYKEVYDWLKDVKRV